MRMILMLLAFTATMASCSAGADTERGVIPRPPVNLPYCSIPYKLAPGERAVEACAYSRLHARQGIVQVQTNHEDLDASLVALSGTDCLEGDCTWTAIVAITNRSTHPVRGDVSVRGW